MVSEPLHRALASNEPWLTSALEAVGDVVAQAEVGVGAARGSCSAVSPRAPAWRSSSVVRPPARYGGVAGLSGGLIGPPGTRAATDGSLAGTPVFLGCSDVDFHIPKERVIESADVLSALGAEVTAVLYPNMDHTVNEDEVARVQKLIAAIVAGAALLFRTRPERCQDPTALVLRDPAASASQDPTASAPRSPTAQVLQDPTASSPPADVACPLQWLPLRWRRDVADRENCPDVRSSTGRGKRPRRAHRRARRRQGARRPRRAALHRPRSDRNRIAAATLKAIADIGYKEVEVHPRDAGQGRSAGAAAGPRPHQHPRRTSRSSLTLAPLPNGLRPGGVHPRRASAGREVPGDAVPDARRAAEGRGRLRPRSAEPINKAGEQVKKAGLQLCYHNHGFEFEPLPDGRRPLDVLLAAVDSPTGEARARRVLGQPHRRRSGGADQAVRRTHRADAPEGQGEGHAAVDTSEAQGAAARRSTTSAAAPLDFPAMLKAAAAAGVEHYFVEQDQTPGIRSRASRRATTT